MLDPRAPGADRRAPVVLAFDTAASACSVAIARDDMLLAHERREMRHGHAEALLPMIDRLVNAAGIERGNIGTIAVSIGPGGFTGIRAGLAAAQGLALATPARLIGVSSFAAVAALVQKAAVPILVALDSRREDFYVQLFSGAGASLTEPAATLPQDLNQFISDVIGDAALRVAGDAAEDAAAALARRISVEIIPGSAPDALGVVAAARREDSLLIARPLYLRAPDVSFPKARSVRGNAT